MTDSLLQRLKLNFYPEVPCLDRIRSYIRVRLCVVCGEPTTIPFPRLGVCAYVWLGG